LSITNDARIFLFCIENLHGGEDVSCGKIQRNVWHGHAFGWAVHTFSHGGGGKTGDKESSIIVVFLASMMIPISEDFKSCAL
jgi:hypothetical protein